MNILMINKFLHPNGGSETYIFRLGRQLQAMGHEVQYFGMDHPRRVVGNRVGAYTSNMDFHGGSKWSKLTYPVKVIYSAEARRKLRQVLDDFQPDVCHLNNFNYQLTPSIILEIRKWERESGRRCKILYTAHDYQLVCPNHLCRNPGTDENCEKCLGGNYLQCAKGRCIHGSFARSFLGTLEAVFWKNMGVYLQIDTIICCSRFMRSKLDADPVLREKTTVLHNFVEKAEVKRGEKRDYVLYFGRYSREKGVEDLIQAAKALPQIPFVFAGSGPLEGLLADIPNVKNMGFQSGGALETLVREARLTVCPSRWYENCPLSVMESISWGTPVLGADIGGIPELIHPGETGALFESGNVTALKETLLSLWQDGETLDRMARRCRENCFDTAEVYAEKLLDLI